MRPAFSALAARLSPGRIGSESQRLRVFEAEAIRRAFPASEIVDAQSTISGMRLLKDAGEVAAIRRAIAISEAALSATLPAPPPA